MWLPKTAVEVAAAAAFVAETATMTVVGATAAKAAEIWWCTEETEVAEAPEFVTEMQRQR